MVNPTSGSGNKKRIAKLECQYVSVSSETEIHIFYPSFIGYFLLFARYKINNLYLIICNCFQEIIL